MLVPFGMKLIKCLAFLVALTELYQFKMKIGT